MQSLGALLLVIFALGTGGLILFILGRSCWVTGVDIPRALSEVFWYFIPFVTVPAAFVLMGAWLFKFCAQRSAALPYVPPVREQVGALPAREILVRGASEPAASNGELLRAAHKQSETGAMDLLRPGVEATRKSGG
jgi:hypothetical protein